MRDEATPLVVRHSNPRQPEKAVEVAVGGWATSFRLRRCRVEVRPLLLLPTLAVPCWLCGGSTSGVKCQVTGHVFMGQSAQRNRDTNTGSDSENYQGHCIAGGGYAAAFIWCSSKNAFTLISWWRAMLQRRHFHYRLFLFFFIYILFHIFW